VRKVHRIALNMLACTDETLSDDDVANGEVLLLLLTVKSSGLTESAG